MKEKTCQAENCKEQGEEVRLEKLKITGVPVQIYLCKGHLQELIDRLKP